MPTVHGKEIPTELHDLDAPELTAFLIIGMQNDMCAPGGITGKAGKDLSMYEAMIPRIAALADECRSRNVPVVHVGIYTLPNGESDSAARIRLRMRARKTAAAESDQPWQPWNGPLIGTWGADFVDELQPRPGEIVIAKYEEEREAIRLAVESIERTTCTRPDGWYCRTMSVDTRDLLVEEGGFLHGSDCYNNDLPHWAEVNGKSHLLVPYTLVINDARASSRHRVTAVRNPSLPTQRRSSTGCATTATGPRA